MARCLPLAVEGATTSISCSPQGSVVVTTTLGGIHLVRVGDGHHRQAVQSFDASVMAHELPIASSFVGGNGEAFLVTTTSNRLLVVNGSGSSEAFEVAGSGCSGPVSLEQCAWSSNQCVVGCGLGALLWDVRSGAALWKAVLPVAATASDENRCVGAVSCQGNLVVIATYDGFLMTYDTRLRAETPPSMVARVENETICAIATSPHGHGGLVSVGCASGRVYMSRVSPSRDIEQAFSTGRRRSVIRSLAMTNSQVLTGHVDGLVTASTFRPDAAGKRFTGQATVDSLIGHDAERHNNDCVAVTSICASDHVAWLGFSDVSAPAPTSVVVGVECDATSGLIPI